MRYADQLAAAVVAPAMIGALESLPTASRAARFDLRASMPTNVEESARARIVVAHEQNGQAADGPSDEVTRRREHRSMCARQRESPKQMCSLELQTFRIDVRGSQGRCRP